MCFFLVNSVFFFLRGHPFLESYLLYPLSIFFLGLLLLSVALGGIDRLNRCKCPIMKAFWGLVAIMVKKTLFYWCANQKMTTVYPYSKKVVLTIPCFFYLR